MKLDLVHDIQTAYRETVYCLSRPGRIGNLAAQAGKVEMPLDCFSSTQILALMLLDSEVTFKVISPREGQVTRLINQLTYAKAVETENADFIFVLHDASADRLEQAMREAKSGDLLNPHRSATIIVEVEELANEKDLVLTGPGIEKEAYVKVQAAGNWVEIRQEKNAEYPLGIDLLFLDRNHRIAGLPRTTQILRQVVG